MSKKKQPKNFKTNPFSDLKGFSVPDEPKVKPVDKPVRKSSPVASEDDFTAAMDSLGVKKLSADSERLSPAVSPPGPVSAAEPEPVQSDADQFLSALGEMDVRFEDEIPVQPEEDSSARRMKQLRRGKLRVEGEVDLHGLTRVEALEKFGFFLTDASYQGWQTVRVITGQGLHSADGPVVRDAIENLLRRETPAEVLEWSRAPQRQGGQGALILFLRKPS